MGRIGIYGGTFNPPHMGHLRAAQFAREHLNMEQLLIVPTCIAPHKQLPRGSANPQQRLEMSKLCFENAKFLRVSDIELCRGDVSYTYETVEQIHALYPDQELVLCMGTDMFLSLDRWKNPHRILELASVAVFCRGTQNERQLIEEKKRFFQAQNAKVYLLDNPVTEISSTDLRRMLVFDCAQPFLHPEVAVYIRQEGLYGTDKCYRNLPIEDLEQCVTQLLNPNRVAHVLGCRQAASELAERYGADVMDAQRAALLHDITKALDGPLQLTLCERYGVILDNFSCNNPKTLHALTGSLVAQRIFGENPAVVSAIESHTTGKVGMNVLEKIIYVADYMEPNRDFPGVERLREAAHRDLDEALEMGLQMTLQVLQEQEKEISIQSVQALAWLEQQKLRKEGK